MCFLHILIPLPWWREQLLNLIIKRNKYYNFWNNSSSPQDTIIIHFQNEKIGFNGEKNSMLFLWFTLKESKSLILEKRRSEHFVTIFIKPLIRLFQKYAVI